MSNKAISVYAEALKRQQQDAQKTTQNGTSKITRKVTRKPAENSTPVRDTSRDSSRNNVSKKPRKLPRSSDAHTSREVPRHKSRDLPTRDEIQEFSFRLRDELKVKVQAEVPHYWHDDLEQLARDLNVKKLELYRYILGDFLGKVNRKPSS